MEKPILRQEVLRELTTLSKNNELKEQKSGIILNKLFKSFLWENANSIGVTVSMNVEFSTELIIKQAWKENKLVAIPKTFSNSRMEFIRYQPETKLKKSKFGVDEPIINDIIEATKIDLLIVPGVVFRKDGYRIGFGGGFYDRYLENFQGETCSLVFSEQYSDSWHYDKHDISVQEIFDDQN